MAYDSGNIFARILRGELPAYRVHEDEHTIAILDVMPQSDGHTLVIPRNPAENLLDLDPALAAAVIITGQRIARAQLSAFGADGITLMQFNGAAAGQTVFHCHLHVIPRYADKPLQSHGRGMAESSLLAEQAARLQAALKA